MTIISNLMLQLFIVLIPFTLFNVYYRDKLNNFSRRFIFLTSSMSLLLSMTFASSIVTGVFFDMRYVITFFCLVFGGINASLILLIEFILYRLYLGGEGVWAAINMIVFHFCLSLLFKKMYEIAVRKYLVTLLAVLSVPTFSLIFTYLYFPRFMTPDYYFHIIMIFVQNFLGIWLLMSLFSKSVADKELFIKHFQNEKFETMSQVAASFAHEVRNPLTAIRGFLKLISEKSTDHKKVMQYAEISMNEIIRTESILTEYLTLTKPPVVKRKIINLIEQLHVISDVITPFANMHNVEIESFFPDHSVQICGNPDEFKQVLINFIKNAVEACFAKQHGKVDLSLLIEKNNAIIQIKDNGIGMTTEQLKRLGTIFFTTKSYGTGLGLTYSYKVIRDMNGKINVSSAPGNTMFTIIIPLAS